MFLRPRTIGRKNRNAPRGSIGNHADTILKMASSDPSTRNIEGVVKILDGEFARPSQDMAIRKINDFANLSRRPGEYIRMFWVRFDKARMAVELAETFLPESVVYSRALAALKLTGANRAVLLSSLEAAGTALAAKGLKDASVKIFGGAADEHSRIVLELAEDESGNTGQEELEENWMVKGKGK